MHRFFPPLFLIETEVSDFHKLVVTVLRSHFKKQKNTKLKNTETINKLTRKNLHLYYQMNEFVNEWNSQSKQMQDLTDSILHFVNNTIPLKTRHLGADQVLQMSRELHKATNSRLKNTYLKAKAQEDKKS